MSVVIPTKKKERSIIIDETPTFSMIGSMRHLHVNTYIFFFKFLNKKRNLREDDPILPKRLAKDKKI